MSTLEQQLQERFPGYRALTTARGCTALYLALKSIAEERGYGDVVVPSAVCPSVPCTIALAGFQPRFCDVELETFCLSPETIIPHLSDRTKAVIVVYLFGKSLHIGRMLELASRRNFLLIEDVAQAIGGEREGLLLGSRGDFSLLSFDDTKIVRGSGGALLVRDERFLDSVVRHRRALGPRVDAPVFQALQRSFRDLPNELYDPEQFRRLFVYHHTMLDTDLAAVSNNVSTLTEERERRFRNYSLYARHLRPEVQHVQFSPTEMCWRLPILTNDHAQQRALVDRIRSEGGLASNHYSPASFAFGQAAGENARQIGLRAVNLWVDAKVGEADILRHCRAVNELVAGK